MAQRLARCGTYLLLALLLVAGPAAAQDPPRTAAARAELEALAIDVRIEAIERATADAAARLERAGAPEKAELVRGKRVTRTFARRHLDADPTTFMEALFAEEVRARRLTVEDLKIDLMLFRGLDGGYRVRDVDPRLLPEGTTGFAPPRSRGYPAEVAAIDNAAPHSMHDLRDYLADRFTSAALERIVSGGHRVELHVGGEAEAFADLKNRGFNVLGEVRSANGNYERLFLAEGPRGELRYVITGDVGGLDRVRHLASLLRFAGAEGRGVPSENVEIVGDVEALKERNYRALREALERFGLGGDTAIIGFRSRLRGELTERALARRGAEHLRDVLGADPVAGLEDRIAAERDAARGAARAKLTELLEKVRADAKLAEGLRADPAEVFRRADRLDALRTAEKTLVALARSHPAQVLEALVADGALRLPGGVSAKGYSAGRRLEGDVLRADEVRVRTSRGVESIMLVNNYYGDAMSEVARALLDAGRTRLAYFGTAGGTGEGVRVGDVHVPGRVYDFEHRLASEGVTNGFVDYFEGRRSPLGERLNVGTELGNVFSPAEETMRWLEETRARGVHAVEVENSYLTREVGRYNRARGRRPRAELFTSVIISDIPGSHLTLGNNNTGAGPSFARMVDHYLDALGVRDVELFSKDAGALPRRPLPSDPHRARAHEVAEALLRRRPDDSRLLVDRLAGILEAVDPAALERVDTSGRVRPADVPGLSAEARAALEAEVSAYYTDAEAIASLERADRVLSRLAAELAERHPRARYELVVGGGIERGAFSPAHGLDLEVRGSPTAARTAAELLERIRAEVPSAPEVRLTTVGEGGVSLGKGEAFRVDPQPLVREHHLRALRERGVHVRGNRVEYVGVEHDVTRDRSALFSRFEGYAVGPEATPELLRSFEERLPRRGARLEYVPGNDPRLAGGQGRTLVAADGSTLVLLPSDRPVRRYALVDELTHVIQLDRLRAELGPAGLAELFARARAGDPLAGARLLDMEIEAKRMVRRSLAADHPDRPFLEREIERLRAIRDPLLAARLPSGRLDWSKVRTKVREHGQGAASFLLGLFLMELARVVETGDRAAIEAFFDGLATTEFWSHYGLFVVGAEAGSIAYTRFLQRFVRPSFVSTVLKSNVALATGMALPMLAHGQLDGRAFAIDLTGLMLSSTAVSAGLAAVRWVTPIGSLARARGASTLLTLARGVPGWVYAGVQTAVVLYFGAKISDAIRGHLDERDARRRVAERARTLLAAARAAGSPDDPDLRAALEEATLAYVSWRDRSLAPALAAGERLNAALLAAGREAATVGAGVSRFSELAERYPALAGRVGRLSAESDDDVSAAIDAAVARFDAERTEGLRRAYAAGRRGSPYDPVRAPGDVSENRLEAYEDEAALYEAAARTASDPEVVALLEAFAATTRGVAARDRALLAAPLRGAADVLEEAGGR